MRGCGTPGGTGDTRDTKGSVGCPQGCKLPTARPCPHSRCWKALKMLMRVKWSPLGCSSARRRRATASSRCVDRGTKQGDAGGGQGHHCVPTAPPWQPHAPQGTCEHGSQADHFLHAVELAGGDEGLGQLRVQRELRHDDPHLRQIPVIIQGCQVVQVLQRLHQRLGGWGGTSGSFAHSVLHLPGPQSLPRDNPGRSDGHSHGCPIAPLCSSPPRRAWPPGAPPGRSRKSHWPMSAMSRRFSSSTRRLRLVSLTWGAGLGGRRCSKASEYRRRQVPAGERPRAGTGTGWGQVPGQGLLAVLRGGQRSRGLTWGAASGSLHA